MLIAHNQRQFPASTRCTPRSMPFVGRALCELSRIVIMLARVGGCDGVGLCADLTSRPDPPIVLGHTDLPPSMAGVGPSNGGTAFGLGRTVHI